MTGNLAGPGVLPFRPAACQTGCFRWRDCVRTAEIVFRINNPTRSRSASSGDGHPGPNPPGAGLREGDREDQAAWEPPERGYAGRVEERLKEGLLTRRERF